MRLGSLWVSAAASVALGAAARAGVTVTTGFNALGANFTFTSVPVPADNDAATAARFTLVDGVGDRNGGGLDVLHDGRVPSGQDQPTKNFFFQAGTAGGRMQVDLGRVIEVKRIGSYSWHAGDRAPQVYTLYAAAGRAEGFKPEPMRGVDPIACGWELVARVDTRPKGGGGQHGVALAAERGVIGAYRYLLFDISQTESRDPFGNTFYSEIDVIDANGPAATSGVVATRLIQTRFEAENGKYRFTIDATDAPDLADWAEKELKPVVQTWYPKLVALLSGDGYQAPAEIALRFRSDMGGTPASAAGAGVNLNAVWFRGELEREALGAVVHEMVHVVQSYGRAVRANPNAVTAPGWVVEGIADYVRWFLYEPQTHGAEISKRNFDKARYDASYRISANFLEWVARRYDRDLVRKLNTAAREGRYDEALWQTWTGKRVQELGDDWRQEQARRLGGAKRSVP